MMRFLPLALLGAALGLAGAACSVGAYPVDVYIEMHYQPSYRSQEPPRLHPPAQSVPVAGREVAYDFLQASELKNPIPFSPEALAQGAGVYRVECAMCHGPGGRGDGPVAQFFQKAGVTTPVDFQGPRVKFRNEGQLYWLLTNGLGFMPPFGRLLLPEERWLLVRYIQSISQASP